MNPRFAILGAVAILAGAPAFADDFGDGLTGIQNEWAVAKYQTTDKAARGDAFFALLEHAGEFSARYPDRAEALAWEGIVLSTYAGGRRDERDEVRKGARRARTGGGARRLGARGRHLLRSAPLLEGARRAHRLRRRQARRAILQKALAVDGDNIDNNYFYGEFLLDQGDYARARAVLEHALAAPAVAGRPVFEAGRRAEIRDLLAVASRKTS
jgi:tetratricopeptide (TPR) repeat protein